jgi:hypothetical protein
VPGYVVLHRAKPTPILGHVFAEIGEQELIQKGIKRFSVRK